MRSTALSRVGKPLPGLARRHNFTLATLFGDHASTITAVGAMMTSIGVAYEFFHMRKVIIDNKASTAKLDANSAKLDAKMDANSARLDANSARLDAKMDANSARLDAKMDAMNTKFDAKFDAMNTKMDQHFSIIMSLIAFNRIPDELAKSLKSTGTTPSTTATTD